MIILVGALLAVATVPLTGGDLRRLAALPVRSLWLVWLAIIAQTLVVDGPWDTPEAFGQMVHLGSYALAVAFLVVNIRLPGVGVIGSGGALNLVAIAANHGVMPATAGAARLAGLAIESGFANSAVIRGARLSWLGDVFGVPASVPLANVFSVGDVLIVVGVGVLAHRWCRHRSVDIQVDTVSATF